MQQKGDVMCMAFSRMMWYCACLAILTLMLVLVSLHERPVWVSWDMKNKQTPGGHEQTLLFGSDMGKNTTPNTNRRRCRQMTEQNAMIPRPKPPSYKSVSAARYRKIGWRHLDRFPIHGIEHKIHLFFILRISWCRLHIRIGEY